MIPILFLLFSGVFSDFFTESPEYEFQKSWSYPIKRSTVVLNVNYYVAKDFE